MLIGRSCNLKTHSPYRNLWGIPSDKRTIETTRDRVTRVLGLKGPRSTDAFAITAVSPFTDSPDCLIIPRSAITPISISSRFAGALYNHSGTVVRESSVSENWTRETFSKLVTFHADTSPFVSYFAFTRPSPFSPSPCRYLFLRSFLFRSVFFSLLPPPIVAAARHELLKPDFKIYIGLAAPAALYRAADFSTIMSLTAQCTHRAYIQISVR